jgi:hypothetical protein
MSVCWVPFVLSVLSVDRILASSCSVPSLTDLLAVFGISFGPWRLVWFCDQKFLSASIREGILFGFSRKIPVTYLHLCVGLSRRFFFLQESMHSVTYKMQARSLVQCCHGPETKEVKNELNIVHKT